MEFLLQRTEKHKDYTIGCLFAGNELICNTLEPTWRDIGLGRKGRKVPGKTAIPEGRYPVVITYSPKFKAWLPLLLHVPASRGYASMREIASRTRLVASSLART